MSANANFVAEGEARKAAANVILNTIKKRAGENYAAEMAILYREMVKEGIDPQASDLENAVKRIWKRIT